MRYKIVYEKDGKTYNHKHVVKTNTFHDHKWNLEFAKERYSDCIAGKILGGFKILESEFMEND